MLFFLLLIKNLIEVSLIYIIALVSGVEHSESVVLFVVFCRLYSMIGYYKILAIIPWAI